MTDGGENSVEEKFKNEKRRERDFDGGFDRVCHPIVTLKYSPDDLHDRDDHRECQKAPLENETKVTPTLPAGAVGAISRVICGFAILKSEGRLTTRTLSDEHPEEHETKTN